ncbi:MULTISPECIES: NAD-dependent protein deacetylase [Herbaspirillum]|jgi:NAD-dependent SIR2 family protein deacetylase|uniref:NAD-dependent protein deacetylase n=1 Tax=Herbaspirillum TaxID=963 RepID=UPI00258A82BF|nr:MULTISPECIES: NAD-dependent protein deacetylase [Herbaspirillum]MCP3657634.1 NAD-dependent protein deacetylase [Herbaspirillum sp.]MCP3949806.1 NAD-dependent protein deacetylase [Herbaspirillum sp.]MCP4035057.1 NAD-dependent protein deacetylase [Herbaspirillum sp.]MCP4556536.1 NAD-dependent protein deacetylase [Herbaspirillum sp.]MEE1637952.1 NAD-dependent protein deacetylase [Herbaspirillum huttiense NC40101]
MSPSLSVPRDAAFPGATDVSSSADTDLLPALAQLLQRHRQVLVLTGAGISTASGIPDYRDDSGVRRGRLPIQGTEFRQSEAARKRYWARSMLGWPRLSQAIPNAAHRALAQLQQAGHLGGILTQNVDGLHQQAGSRDVIELHGSIHAVRCLACDTVYPRAEIQQELARCNPSFVNLQAEALPDGDARLEPEADAAFHVPACVACGGMLQPDVVFFGDGVPPARTAQAEAAAQACDAMLVIGSSLMVLSGFRFPRTVAAAGKPVVAINRGVTRADDLLAFKLREDAESVLPRLATLLGADGS